MNEQKVSYDLTEELYGQLSTGIKSLDANLAFAVNLTTEDKKKSFIMGDKSIAFVEKALQFANDRPDLVPPFLDMAEFERDLKLAKQLRDLSNLLAPVMEKVTDTGTAAGIDAFAAARKFYNYVKAAALSGAPGSDTIAEEMKKRWSRIRKPAAPTQPTTADTGSTTQTQ